MPTANQIRERWPAAFPEDITDAQINAAIAEAEAETTTALPPTRRDLAVLYLSAHLATRDAAVGAVSAVPGAQSITVGPVSVSYGAGGAGADGGASTSFYERYREIIDSSPECRVAGSW